MAVNRLKAKSRRESGAFVPLPVSVLNGENFVRLSPKAVKLLLDLCSQIRFKQGGTVNNGDLCAAMSLMQPRGWKSEETLINALDELIHFGFVIRTRQGSRRACSLFAVTWWSIDECQGKLDVSATRVPSNEWRNERGPFITRRKAKRKKTVPRKSRQCTPTIGVKAGSSEALGA